MSHFIVNTSRGLFKYLSIHLLRHPPEVIIICIFSTLKAGLVHHSPFSKLCPTHILPNVTAQRIDGEPTHCLGVMFSQELRGQNDGRPVRSAHAFYNAVAAPQRFGHILTKGRPLCPQIPRSR
jgi:hypothetical protein